MAINDLVPKNKGGCPITTGTTPTSEFVSILKRMGIDKKELLELADKEPDSGLMTHMRNRVAALQFYQGVVEITKDFYNQADKRTLSLITQLQDVDAMIQEHKFKNLDNPEYDPVNDKNLLKWLKMRQELSSIINKEKIELAKLQTDIVREKGGVTSEDIVWDVD